MKVKFTLLNLLLLFVFSVSAQDLTGIWRGYFVQNSFGISEDRYKFEIQIDQSNKDALKGVTYSYRTTVFYGKADLQGLYTRKTRNLIFKENKLMEVKIGDNSEPCLMTCYLDYTKMGNLETFTGTYTSRNMKSNSDCGSGKVYLERVVTTDFVKEDFIVKHEAEVKKRALANNNRSNKPKPAVKEKPKPSIAAKPALKPKIKPGAEENLVTKEDVVATPKVITPQKTDNIPVPKPLPPKPEVVKRRSNELVKTIFTSSREIKIQLYDNGEIDGDTITVYHNNELIVSRKRLTDKPITFSIKADEGSFVHEFVMVAENLGSIPPNTALMIITAGDKRYELFVTSTEKKNAVVVLEYKPEGT